MVLGIGLLGSAIGSGLMLGLQVGDGAWVFAVGFMFVGAGIGIAVTLTSDLVISSVAPDRAGAASAISETAYEMGIALGVAVLGSVVMALFRNGLDVSGLSPEAAHAAADTLGGAVKVAGEVGPGIGPAVLESAQHAFVSGAHIAALATAAVLLVNAVAVFRLMRTR